MTMTDQQGDHAKRAAAQPTSDLRDALAALLETIGNLTPTWRNDSAIDEWASAIAQARAALDAHDAGGWLPAGEAPEHDDRPYWRSDPGVDGYCKPRPTVFNRRAWDDEVSIPGSGWRRVRWSRHPISVPPPPADEGGA